MEAGERILLKTKKGEYEGIVMPNTDNKTIFLKLKSGYNIGIESSEITEKRILAKAKPMISKKLLKKTPDKNLPNITLIHTGGTIASKVDYETGAVISKFTPEEILEMFPEIKKIANIKSKITANVLSENIRFRHYNEIAKEIEAEIKSKTDGIIITHGTDTMHYTSAALSFMLENLNVPVVLVGAQRSSDRPSTDAYQNLLNAAFFISKSKTPGVFICMHKDLSDESALIMKGVKARKMHTSRRDAFLPVNSEAFAEVSYLKNYIKENKKSGDKRENNTETKNELRPRMGELKIKTFKENIKIGLLKSRPNMHADEFTIYENYDGLIIEGTGLGHLPLLDEKENEKIFSEVKKLAKKIPVAMASQTIYGRTDMNVYSAGRKLIEAGILGNYCDMTPETAYIKLAWLLSNKMKPEEFFEKNLRGEITERSQENFYSIKNKF